MSEPIKRSLESPEDGEAAGDQGVSRARESWDPDSTPARLCRAAEELFSEHGFRNSSVRDVTQRAGVNVAAVSYHFGSKEGLLRVLVERRVFEINDERRQLLELARRAAGDRPPTVDSIGRAFVGPVFRSFGHDSSFPQLMSRLMTEDLESLLGPVFQEQFMEVFDEFAAALSESLPHVSPSRLRTRLALSIGAMHFALVPCGPLNVVLRQDGTPVESDYVVDELVKFMANGLQAEEEQDS